MSNSNPEIGRSIVAGGIATNYHDIGSGFPLLMIHGSGPGVSAWANWRANLPVLGASRRAIAPDLVGFGFTERPHGIVYDQHTWIRHAFGLLDALEIETADILGNSFGGGLAMAMAIAFPRRIRRLVLMGSVGIEFPLTPGLDTAWSYQPSVAAMRELLDLS